MFAAAKSAGRKSPVPSVVISTEAAEPVPVDVSANPAAVVQDAVTPLAALSVFIVSSTV